MKEKLHSTSWWQLAIGLTISGLTSFVPAAQPESPRFAYGVNGDDYSLSTYRVEASGRLRHMGHRPIDKAPPMVVVHPSGRFVLAVSSTMDNLAVFRLDAESGALTPVAGSPFPVQAKSPFNITFHPSGRFVYMGARFSGVAAMAFDSDTGSVKPVPGTPFPAQRRTRAVAMHPSGRYLYAVNAYSNSVSAYRVDQETGVLTEMSDSPYLADVFKEIDYPGQGMLDVPPEAGGIPHFIDMDPQGRFVFVPNRATASVSVFAINKNNGGLKAVTGSPFFVGYNPYRSRVHPSGRFVLTTLWADRKVAVHAVNQDTGKMIPVEGSPFAVDSDMPVDVTFKADGSQVYVSTYDGNEIVLLDMDVSSGHLQLRERLMTRLGPWSLALAQGKSPAQSKPVKPEKLFATGAAGLMQLNASVTSIDVEAKVGGHGDSLVFAPDGRFGYVLNKSAGSITSFAIDTKNGTMMPVPQGMVNTGAAPTDMIIDVNGWYLYVINSGENSFSIYYLDPKTGIPKPVRGSPIRTAKRPVSITLDAAARYAFVVNAGSNNISTYRYYSSVMPLMFESSKYGSPYPAGNEPVSLVVNPTGHFAYVANAGSNDISAYHIHRKTGALVALPGSPFKAGQRPVDLKVHPNGKWLYVVHQKSQEIIIYEIEPELGALRQVGKTVRLPVKLEKLWLDELGKTLLVLGDGGHRLFSFNVGGEGGNLEQKIDKHLSQPVYDIAGVRQMIAVESDSLQR
jgi:6-phosphogluconolactonase (cycloisomerase 2 family)